VDLDVDSEIRQQGGTVGIVKAGGGTLRLEGPVSNSYTGPTTVNAGTLELNKSLFGGVPVAVPADLTINGAVVRELLGNQVADTAAVNVNSGGTFDLHGQTDTVGPVTVTGGTLTTGGTSAGRLTASNTSFNAAATLAMRLVDAAASDRITVSGTVAVGGALQVSAASPVSPGTAITLIDNDGTDAVAGTFAGLPKGAVVTVGGQTFTISYTGGTGNDVVLTRVVPPNVSNVQINGGAAQRSMVTNLAVTFSTVVTLPANAAAAFTLQRIGGGPVSIGTATTRVVNGVTEVTLSGFSGAEASAGGSLNDGRYTLAALAASITANVVQLDGNGDGVGGDDFVFADGGTAGGLFRLFGDVNGDRTVNITDLTAFRNAFGATTSDPNYQSFLDFNGDGVINLADLTQFRNRFGIILP